MKKISIDLSTLVGWQNLTYDEHSFVVKAKASGYQDSDNSEIFKITKQLPSGGETWVFNDELLDEGGQHFTVNFTSNGQNFIQLDVKNDNEYMRYRRPPITANDYVYAIDEWSWTDEMYKTVTFETAPTGELLAWLQRNAVKLVTDDLTGWTWVGNDVIDATGISFPIHFTSDNTNFIMMDDDASSGNKLTYTTASYATRSVYYTGDGWSHINYKTITITGGTYATNTTAIAWFEANGTLTAPQPPQSGFTVSVTGVVGDGSNYCYVFDGNDESGVPLGYLGAETKTYQIASGYIYLQGSQYRQTTPTTTGGVFTASLGDWNMLFRVTGDGTINNVGFWCFAEGTLITLADGSRKAVEDITYDDDLLVWNFYEGKFDSAKPTWIMPVKQAPEYNKLTFANGSELKLVGPGGNIGYHRIYNDDAKCFTHTGVSDTQVGCHTFTDDGVFTELVSQEVVKESVNYYNIITEKHYNLFTNGILTSCRLSNQYDIENMKYVGESKMSEQEIAEYLERLER